MLSHRSLLHKQNKLLCKRVVDETKSHLRVPLFYDLPHRCLPLPCPLVARTNLVSPFESVFHNSACGDTTPLCYCTCGPLIKIASNRYISSIRSRSSIRNSPHWNAPRLSTCTLDSTYKHSVC